jgi:hypothetical protein
VQLVGDPLDLLLKSLDLPAFPERKQFKSTVMIDRKGRLKFLIEFTQKLPSELGTVGGQGRLDLE